MGLEESRMGNGIKMHFIINDIYILMQIQYGKSGRVNHINNEISTVAT
jgi:hypothetical protein